MDVSSPPLENNHRKLFFHYALLFLEGPLLFWIIAVFLRLHLSMHITNKMILPFVAAYFLVTGSIVGLTSKTNINKNAIVLGVIHFVGLLAIGLFFNAKTYPGQLLSHLTFTDVLFFFLLVGLFLIGNLLAFTFYKFKLKFVLVIAALFVILFSYFSQIGVFLDVEISPVKSTYAFNDELSFSITLRNFSPFPYSYGTNCGEYAIENKENPPAFRSCIPEYTSATLYPFEKKVRNIKMKLVSEDLDEPFSQLGVKNGQNVIVVDWIKEKLIKISVSK